ncbi:hypothetical protein EXIGLDRAFT_369472 [Exidia glandulosa HHB12029]|uniref:Uncharacterized protein n=1 Tax=Exidia glandulosa HHB12029 TaxID=1314781 RepID=A0A165C2W4_EXIGL|nr:hypothetical protein EXIGLDRAFT_369472 [Exidia glandulosa HHB12029]
MAVGRHPRTRVASKRGLFQVHLSAELVPSFTAPFVCCAAVPSCTCLPILSCPLPQKRRLRVYTRRMAIPSTSRISPIRGNRCKRCTLVAGYGSCTTWQASSPVTAPPCCPAAHILVRLSRWVHSGLTVLRRTRTTRNT